MESESEESEHFHFFQLRHLHSAYELVKTRLWWLEAEVEG